MGLINVEILDKDSEFFVKRGFKFWYGLVARYSNIES